jgi:hypothetical protein
MLLKMVSAQSSVAGILTMEITNMHGLEFHLLAVPALPKLHHPMAILQLILLSVSLLMSSWKQQLTHWEMHGTILTVMRMVMHVPGTLSMQYAAEIFTTTWLLIT